VDQYQRALQIRPDYALAHNNLASTLLQTGNSDEALAHFREAIRLDPTNAEAHGNLGSLLRARGDAANAVAELRRAVELNPDSVPVVAALASLLATTADATLRRPAEAVAMAQRAVDLTGKKDAGVLDVLAAAYAAARRFAEAVASAEAALALNPTEPLASRLRQRLGLYRQGREFVAPR
jgi:Flp pilus assembly protein TadD